MRRFVIAVAVLLAGCDLYFDDDDDECKNYATEGDIAPEYLQRNPDTGQCQGNGGYPCDDRCGPCPVADQAERDWGSCYSECDGKTADQCMATPGCYAAFTEFPSTPSQPAAFRGCWQTAPSGPIVAACDKLDAYGCSRTDTCTAHYTDDEWQKPDNARLSPDIPTQFMFCKAEAGSSCGATTCGPGTHCEEQCTVCEGGGCQTCQPTCVPDGNACTAIDCGPGWSCTEVCSGGSCGAQCVPSGTCEAITTEGACKTRPDCTTVYTGEDCTCYPGGYCECNVLTYERCETK